MLARIIHGSLQDSPRICRVCDLRVSLTSLLLGTVGQLLWFECEFSPKLICLSTGFLASSTVWVLVESLGGGVMLEEAGHWGMGLEGR